MADEHRVTKVFMLTLFPREGNGSSTVVRDLANVISSEVEVMVFYVDTEKASFETYRTHWHIVDDFPVLRTHPKSKKRQQFISMTAEQIDQYIDQIYQAALPAVKEFQPDVIHVHHGWLGAQVAKRLSEETSIEYLVQFHGTELEVRSDYASQDTQAFTNLDNIVRDGLAGASIFSVISPTEEDLTTKYAKDAGLSQTIRMIPNGYDDSIFSPAAKDIDWINKRFADHLDGGLDPDRPIVMFVGRFAGFKGIEHLVRAVPHYAASGAQTILCGGGELHAPMIELAKTLDLKDVFFLGHVDHFDDLPKLYNAADVLVIPSHGEPFGLVAIEAMGCGTPFIGADSGALPYILGSTDNDEKSGNLKLTPLGVLVPFGDAEATAEAINFALSTNLKQRIGAKVRAAVQEEFTVQTQARRYRDLYQEVFDRRGCKLSGL
ncbi:MAG: glycosyltransferase family 4 protein [bacterium]|nr:glycosyltransferase family 4 protein [bacterium]